MEAQPLITDIMPKIKKGEFGPYSFELKEAYTSRQLEQANYFGININDANGLSFSNICKFLPILKIRLWGGGIDADSTVKNEKNYTWMPFDENFNLRLYTLKYRMHGTGNLKVSKNWVYHSQLKLTEISTTYPSGSGSLNFFYESYIPLYYFPGLIRTYYQTTADVNIGTRRRVAFNRIDLTTGKTKCIIENVNDSNVDQVYMVTQQQNNDNHTDGTCNDILSLVYDLDKNRGGKVLKISRARFHGNYPFNTLLVPRRIYKDNILNRREIFTEFAKRGYGDYARNLNKDFKINQQPDSTSARKVPVEYNPALVIPYQWYHEVYRYIKFQLFYKNWPISNELKYKISIKQFKHSGINIDNYYNTHVVFSLVP